MMRKLINSVIIIMILFLAINVFNYKIYGADTVDQIFQGAQGFIEAGAQTATIDQSQLHETSNFIFNMLLAVAMVLAVIVGMVLGIKFMTSSVEEKAKIKETLVPYFVSCIVIFGAFGIWKLAITILSNW